MQTIFHRRWLLQADDTRHIPSLARWKAYSGVRTRRWQCCVLKLTSWPDNQRSDKQGTPLRISCPATQISEENNTARSFIVQSPLHLYERSWKAIKAILCLFNPWIVIEKFLISHRLTTHPRKPVASEIRLGVRGATSLVPGAILAFLGAVLLPGDIYCSPGSILFKN